ncbi:electron transport complex subunit RsxC [Bacteroidales bacterium OttesenSCG-928-B11]|nr:electron transport complex subunit RsxC [Bacteroidales bacterium OttesenSCG-928-B11]
MITFKKGGVHPEENKFTNSNPIEIFPIPSQVTLFTGQHLGVPAVPVVDKGDVVKVGQLVARGEAFISANIHSPVSGVVQKIEPVADALGHKKTAIVINVEDDVWEEKIDRSPDIIATITRTKEEIINTMKDCGIVGLGGACFPVHVKYMVPPDKKVDYLLINAAECEPYITTDYRVMIEHGKECLIGIEAMLKASGAPVALIGVENNKRDAIRHLTKLAKDHPNIKIRPLKVKYPQGAEKQLIQALTNRRVPAGKLPIEVGVIVNNITTTFAVYEAVQKNKPLIETFTTVTGKKVMEKRNYRIRLGTPIMDVLNSVGIPENTKKIIAGGPMMGKAIANLNSFAVKGMSSLLMMDDAESYRGDVANCLRCGRCVTVCPMGLEPVLLQPLAEQSRWEECEKNGIMNCIECGSCQFECPANRPLLDFIRLGKHNTGLMIRNRKN